MTERLLDLLEEWRRQQAALAARVLRRDAAEWHLADPARCTLRLVGGLDISFAQDSVAEGEPVPSCPDVAALVVLSFPSLEVVYEDLLEVHLDVPYCAGYLGFRECPAYLQLLQRARQQGVEPQVLLVDGFGVLHPRRLGSASHLGVLAGLPTVGVAKSLLHVGGLDERTVRAAVRAQQQAQQAEQAAAPLPGAAQDIAAEQPVEETPGTMTACAAAAAAAPGGQPGQPAGSSSGAGWLPLTDVSSGEVLGAAVCPPGCAKPIYVSVGHQLSLETAVELALRCCRHRIPEPIRQADLRSRERIRQLAAQRAQHAQQAAAAAQQGPSPAAAAVQM